MSSDREAFVAAIRERPDDDGPRLVCADWFEEQGDDASVARAEFIRTQVSRARLAPNDPQQSELEARELRLLRQYARVWCGSHRVFKKARFRRGFIEYVHLHLQHFQHHRRQMFALEPVRDVSLTGWMRAPDDLVRRVAACEELRHVETLRIHHQGPHKSPRSNLAILLGSPHLTGLKSLRLPMLAIDADARRRIERSPAFARVSELSLPHLDTYPTNAGAWFSDGVPAGALARLRSLRLKDYLLRPQFLDQLSAAPFWDGLRSLDIDLPDNSLDELVSLLRDRLPPQLESFRLAAHSSPVTLTNPDDLYARLATRPLRRLEIHWVPVGPAALGSLLGGQSRCELRELRLLECGLRDEHLAVISRSPAVGRLYALDLWEHTGVTSAAAETFLSSADFGCLVKLGLGITTLYPRGLGGLGRAPWFGRLRRLGLFGAGLTASGVARLLESANAPRLVRLTVRDGYPRVFLITPALVDRLARLPHLARLSLQVTEMTDEAREQLNSLRSHVWSTIRCHSSEAEFNVERGHLPPLDEDLEELDQWS